MMMRRLGNAVLATGSSQLFWFLSLPLIGRLYSPEAIGLYGQVIAYAAAISLVIGARSDLAVLTAPAGAAAITRKAFSKLSLLLILPVGVVAFLIGSFSNNVVLKFPLLAAVLVGGYLANLFLLNGMSLVKALDYASLRNSGFWRSAAQTAAQVSLSVFGLAGLVGGKILGDLLGALMRKSRLPQDQRPRAPAGHVGYARLDKRELAAIKRNAPAFKYSLPQSIISSITQNSPYFLLPAALAPKQMGLFAMAFSIVVSPIGLIGAPVRQTFVAHFSTAEARKTGEAERLLYKSSILLLVMGVVCCIAFHFLVPSLVSMAFGRSWAGLADYARVLSYWPATGVASIPAIAYLLARDRNSTHLRIEIVTGIGRVAALMWGVKSFAGWVTVLPFVLVSAVFGLVTIGLAFSHAGSESSHRKRSQP